ncbi:2-oxo acid dehydrogenase subunit E2 [Conexibacter sp. DBS9H8]|uniref:2-oxo acid dehydrogenase subunit E2 n=1 Tax=Conexibacter sp. DBS9H8 TaxID=2937801 RepID=UPI0020108AC6|nr:2-oxo acid dehydrogenase subunit E2 [Conexibacter sp. DBS9H8]
MSGTEPAGPEPVVDPETAPLRGIPTLLTPSRLERTVARRSAEIRATVPDADYSLTVPADGLVEAAAAEDVPAVALLIAAVARALTRVPRLNAGYRDGRGELYSRVNLGVTIAAEGVYVVPTLFNCETKPANLIAAELADYRARALADRLESAELAGGTFTVADFGADGLTAGTPLVVGGQAGALGIGAIRAVPVVRDGAVVPGHEITLTLAVDHRIVQSSDAGRFLAAVAEEVAGT